jgi:hypothetical protein
VKHLHHIFAFHNFSENRMSSIKPGTRHKSDEKLGAVGVGTSIGHGQQVGLVMLEQKVFVVELGTVDRLAASAVVVGEVASLSHEVSDDSVEVRALVSEALLVGAEGAEVGCGFGDLLVEELEDQFAGLVVAEVEFEEHVFEGHLNNKYLRQPYLKPNKDNSV